MPRATVDPNPQFSFSASRQRLLLDALPQMIWTAADADGAPTFFSGRWVEYAGVSVEQLLKSGWAGLVHDDDRAETRARWDRARATGQPMEAECRIRRADGAYRWHHVRAVRVHDDADGDGWWVGSCLDVHDHRVRQALLAESEERYRLLVDGVRDVATLMLDTEGHVVSWSDAAERLKGYKAVEIAGKHFSTFYTPEQLAEGRPAQLLRIAKTEGRVEDEGWRVRKDGTRFWANVLIAALRDGQGNLRGFAKVTRDFTERKRADEALRQRAAELAQLAEQLKRKNAELDQFAYITSHDLKAPLRGIANLSEWIEEDMGDRFTPEARQQMDLLRGRVRRMEGLIEGILQISRVGRVRANPERVDVSLLLRDVVDLLHPSSDVVIEIAEQMPVLFAERLRLEQVFMNLVGNALKHGRPTTGVGRVRVAAEDRGSVIEFTVSDNGPGIAPEYHDKIFVIFQTLAARDRVEGTGLGLSLVKKIVEDQGGQIHVESAEGAGATFRFTWQKTAPVRESTGDPGAPRGER